MTDYKRRVYLINPKFQLKFSFYVCIIVFISSLIYPITIYDLFGKFVNIVAQSNPAYTNTLEEKRSSIIVILSLWQTGFTAMIFIICIFFSHKIAGPVYKLTNHLKKIRSGDSISDLSFRNGDYFPELANELNSTLNQFQTDHKNDFVYLDEINSYLQNLRLSLPEDKHNLIDEITERLSNIKHRYGAE